MNWFTRKLLTLVCILASAFTEARAAYFEIQVVDESTGRGVPMVELDMVNRTKYLTDSAGRAAIDEPGFDKQSVFFSVRSHGYEMNKDGFGYAGARLKYVPGGKEILKLKRVNIAERLYRNTGAGIYRDSVLLGHTAPIDQPLLNARVMGQDSIQRVIHRGKVYWFWGDTLQPSYPLGNFRMSGAVSDLPTNGGLAPEVGINLKYFTAADGFAKGMFPIEPKGDLIWADGFIVLPDGEGRERMVAHYMKLKGLGKPLGRGLAIYNDDKTEFEQLKELDLAEKWRFPQGHSVTLTNNGVKYFYFGLNVPTVRVRADFTAITDASAYEAFSCLADGSSTVPDEAKLLRDEQGALIYRWTKNAPPTGAREEQAFIKAGLMKTEEALFQPIDVESGKPIQLHAGSVSWNAWRKKWVLICSELYGSSMLGEIWFAEADEPTGPWKKARKIVTHDKYSFYNPAQHPFFEQEGGRVIYFEGTYTAEFSGNTSHTPRYDYNQIMYRLDLADSRLKAAME
ncbi:MAG: hypothetical protein ACXW32_11650 [Limisphaerales bacterium]